MQRTLLLLLFGLLVSLVHYTAWGQKNFDIKMEEEKCIIDAQQIILDLKKSDFEAALNKINSISPNKYLDIAEIKKHFGKLSQFLKEHDINKIHKFVAKDASLNSKEKHNSVGHLVIVYKYIEKSDTVKLCDLNYFKNLLTDLELSNFHSYLDTKKIDASKLPPPKH